jgi:hypothetical protein
MRFSIHGGGIQGSKFSAQIKSASLTPLLFILVLVSRQGSERSCILDMSTQAKKGMGMVYIVGSQSKLLWGWGEKLNPPMLYYIL